MPDSKSLRYAPTHEWVSVEGAVATVGISKFAVDQLTDLIHLDLPPVGKRVDAGQGFGEVESVKAVSDLYAPVSGEVVEVNELVKKDIQPLADDPFGRGWLIKLRMSDPREVDSLLDFAAYEKQVAESEH